MKKYKIRKENNPWTHEDLEFTEDDIFVYTVEDLARSGCLRGLYDKTGKRKLFSEMTKEEQEKFTALGVDDILRDHEKKLKGEE